SDDDDELHHIGLGADHPMQDPATEIQRSRDPLPRASVPRASVPNVPVANDLATEDPTDRVHEALIGHGLPSRLLERLLDASFAAGIDDPKGALIAALQSVFSFQPLAERRALRPLMLVGVPGAGKTVSTAKLAARALFAGEPVRVVTTDSIRAGAVEQLDAFTRLMKLSLHSATSPAQLARLVDASPPGERILIDTAGVNPYSSHDLAELKALAKAASAEPVLVMAAGGDAYDAVEQASAFCALGVRRMIVTRLDMVHRLGSVLAAADAGRLAFAETSITSAVVDGLIPADAAAIARLLMPSPTHETLELSSPKTAIRGHRP
ncbi:MAG TPA: AAA family ATPase, partial [Stellaceae bacterium]|nr:AAA family ATPase [Stellaceae bacterium]